jgi:hypothetical protein
MNCVNNLEHVKLIYNLFKKHMTNTEVEVFKVWDIIYFTNSNVPIFWKSKITRIDYNWDTPSIYYYKLNNGKEESFTNWWFYVWRYSKDKNKIIKQFIKSSENEKNDFKKIWNFYIGQNYYFVKYFYSDDREFYWRGELVDFSKTETEKEVFYTLIFRSWIIEKKVILREWEEDKTLFTEEEMIEIIDKM